MTFNYFSKNGQILPIAEATIPLSNIAYQYGFGVYENIKVRNQILYFVDQHLDRLFISAETIGLAHSFSKDQIKQYIKDLTSHVILSKAKNLKDPSAKPQDDKVNSFNLKILLLGGKEPSLFILPLAPHFTERKLYTEGAKTITVKGERLFPQAKTLNMLTSYLAYTKAKAEECYDALLLDAEGNIVEGTRTNFFAIKENRIFSPPKEKILEGVTKLTVLAVAEKHGFILEEGDIPLAEMSLFDGAFLTSTSAKIVPIKQIDDISLQIPEKVKELIHHYDSFLEESKGIFSS